jgi:hypothetical protein
MIKIKIFLSVCVGLLIVAVIGAYWWSNIPPRRPLGVSSNAVFLWAGHLGLPAPKHGTWLECWTDSTVGENRCRLTEMDGTRSFEGAFLANRGNSPVPQSDLHVLTEQTSQSVDLWVRVNTQLVPLVFLQNGTVLIPSDAYQEGMAKLEHLREVQGSRFTTCGPYGLTV